jgi:hypothetical protein
MAAHILTNAQVVLGSSDLTPFSGQISMAGKVNQVDVTTFGSGGYQQFAPGLETYAHSLSGFSDMSATGVNSLVTMANLGTQYGLYCAPQGGATAGDPVIFTRGVLSEFAPFGGSIGEASKFSIGLNSDTALVDGYVLAPLVSRGALTGSPVTMTGPTATQKVYAALFITGAPGTGLTVTVQSAPTSGFASPTTRFTFTTTSAIGYQFAVPVAGAITDGFWRAVATVTTSTFTWAAHIGVLDNS